MAQPTTGPRESQHLQVHPIAAAVAAFVHRARDTKLAARQHLPLASLITKKRFREIKDDIDRLTPLLKNQDHPTAILAQKELAGLVQRFTRLRSSNVPRSIETGLFLSLFAAFDAFVGDLLRAIYTRKPQLLGSINRELRFGDVLAASSLNSLKEQVLEDDIEALRRKSYPEQFAQLTTRFDVKLVGFASWPAFVECSQRRNLLTHCDGIVSEQYLKICREHGVPADGLPSEGERLALGATYFYDSCELVLEVGVMLGQTLWRKTLPGELEEAEEHLMSLLFDTLENRQWERGRKLGKFALSQKQFSSERNRRVLLVNYVQALKRSGKQEDALRVLSEEDWSAAGNEFRLADRVLREQYDEAAALMRRIGPGDTLVTEHAYHTWPLFLEFRDTDLFAQAYRDVFGHAYVSKLERDAARAAEGAAAEAVKEDPSSADPEKASDRFAT